MWVRERLYTLRRILTAIFLANIDEESNIVYVKVRIFLFNSSSSTIHDDQNRGLRVGRMMCFWMEGITWKCSNDETEYSNPILFFYAHVCMNVSNVFVLHWLCIKQVSKNCHYIWGSLLLNLKLKHSRIFSVFLIISKVSYF